MFDFTRSARIIALALPAYILLWPLWVIVGGLVDVVSGSRGMLDAADWLSWPVPCVFALLSLILLGDLWQRLSAIQEQLARQSADSGAHAIEARALARQAQDVARDTAARQAVLEQRLSEVALQRTQLEDLMQSLSRSRDENLVEDIQASLRVAQQQTQLTGSAEPLLAALRSADDRLAQQVVLRLEPAVDRPRGQPRLFDDVEDLRAGVALTGEHARRRVEQLLAQRIPPLLLQRLSH